VHPIDRVILVNHSLTDCKPPPICGIRKSIIEVLELVALESIVLGVYHADGLLYRFLECPTDTHDFTNSLHGAANVALDVSEFAQIPSRDLGDNIIKTGLKVCCSCSGDGIR